MSTNSLGGLTFIRMDDGDLVPETLQREGAIVQRPGVPDSGVIDMGSRGQPFDMPTVRDVSGRMTAEQLVKTYRQLPMADPLNLVFAGINYTEIHECRYIVLRVHGVRIKYAAVTSGGIVGGDHLVYATFALLPVFA